MEHFNNDVVPDRTTMRDRVIIRAAAQAKGYREGLEKRGLHAEYALMLDGVILYGPTRNREDTFLQVGRATAHQIMTRMVSDWMPEKGSAWWQRKRYVKPRTTCFRVIQRS